MPCVNFRNGSCGCLQVQSCPSHYSFRMTKDEENISKQNWKCRMNSLPQSEQEKYADTYYGGKMPWKQE